MAEAHAPADRAAPTPSVIRAHPERERTREAPRILAAGLVAHVGFVAAGRPQVIQMTYHYAESEPFRLYLHGGVRGRLMAHLAGGASVCVAVTELDGLVYSRSALHHSVNYRSVVLTARAAREQPGPTEGGRILEAMIARYFPGRKAGVDYEAATGAQLAATALVALDIEEWSAKVREGGPTGPGDDDPARPGSAGVTTLRPGDPPSGRGRAVPPRATVLMIARM